MNTFKSKLTINNIPLDKSFIFPGGEIQIRLPEIFLNGSYVSCVFDKGQPEEIFIIKTILNSADAVMELLMTKKALDYYFPTTKKELICWYMPYMRQDRICYAGECNSSSEFLKLLLNMKFSSIYTADLHSILPFRPYNCYEQNNGNFDGIGLCVGIFTENSKNFNTYTHLTTFTELSSLDILKEIKGKNDVFEWWNKKDWILVAPDKGAARKVEAISNHFGIPFLFADKVRDTSDGKIIKYDINMNGIESIENKKLLVIDDICDGGRTFTMIAKSLLDISQNINLKLYVTHGIFSNGVDLLYRAGYTDIITTNSFRTVEEFEEMDERICVLNLESCLDSILWKDFDNKQFNCDNSNK